MGSYNSDLAKETIPADVLPLLVSLLSQENKYLKRAAVLVFRSAAKHSEILAQTVVDSGALSVIIDKCLSDFTDHPLQESAVWTIGNIAKHSLALASTASSSLPLLIQTAGQTSDVTLKRISLAALADIARHSSELALQILSIDPLFLASLLTGLSNEDSGMRKQASACLSQIVKHDTKLFPMESVPAMILALQDPVISKNIATVLRELARDPIAARELVSRGALPALVECVAGEAKLPAVMALGYIGVDEEMARSVFTANPIPVLKNALINDPDDIVKGAIVWTLGQLGKHCSDLANRLAENDIFRRIFAVFFHDSSSSDLRAKCIESLALLIPQTTTLGPLEVLVSCVETDAELKVFLLDRFSQLLSSDPAGRKSFVQSGCLEKIQEWNDKEKVNKLFPTELVNFYSPGYQAELLKQLD